jgi:hypothetical protein
MHQMNLAEKATQLGARKAVTWDLVAPALESYTGVSGSLGGGDPLPANLQVPGGAVVPSVTVRLRGLTYDFILLDAAVAIATAGAVDLNNLFYPSFSTTLTGEDLSDSA